tara:strand:- start:373 stop:1107 length:735 start_codon:yes stop_codon:yes gene_type:complete
MAKLNQIIAVANGKKTACTSKISELYHTIQRGDAFGGFERRYQPSDDEGETLPSERKMIQETVADNLSGVQASFVELMDVIATQEFANCDAKADIVVDGVMVVADVPVTYMLFLEKQLDHIKSIVSKLPVLASDVKWNKSDSDENVYVADTVVTNRTKKVPKAFIKAEATTEHPAQVEVFTEDVIVGTWNKIDMSSAIPVTERDTMLKKVEKLREATKMAREEANSLVVGNVKVGEAITDFVFK